MHQLNRTKIVATVGPASRAPKTIEAMVKAGVSVFRLNCAHADHKTLAADVRTIRHTARRLKAMVGILVDLQGPKMRIGRFHAAQPIWLERGRELVISTRVGVIGRAGDPLVIGTSYRRLSRDVKAGERMLLDDGNIELKVLGVSGSEIRTKVVHGGLLMQSKGINVPGSNVSAKSISSKDIADLNCAVEAGADFIAMSFVRTADDVRKLVARIRRAGSQALAIAKIERPEAVENLAEIMAVADGVMVARGDMGVELGPEAVPALQKQIIRLGLEARKPVITATQMLESMVSHPRPTRAEASDVANAIYDGTSAVMLSAETASGKYPVGAVRVMQQIVQRTEADMFGKWDYRRRRRRRGGQAAPVSEATVKAAGYAAVEVEAKAIAVFTESGATAQLMAGERAPTRIVAFTPFQGMVQRLALTWGVTAIRSSKTRTSHEMTLEGERILLARRLARRGDPVVVVFGTSRVQGLANVMNIRVLA